MNLRAVEPVKDSLALSGSAPREMAIHGPLLESIRHLDGLVTLTDRQREDVAERYGKTNNLFVVPNPVELPTLPNPMPEREPETFAIVSRLETQKRLDHAIRAPTVNQLQTRDTVAGV